MAEYYVDCVDGDDAWDGTVPIYTSGTTGPKITVAAGIALMISSGDTLWLSEGVHTVYNITPPSSGASGEANYNKVFGDPTGAKFGREGIPFLANDDRADWIYGNYYEMFQPSDNWAYWYFRDFYIYGTGQYSPFQIWPSINGTLGGLVLENISSPHTWGRGLCVALSNSTRWSFSATDPLVYRYCYSMVNQSLECVLLYNNDWDYRTTTLMKIISCAFSGYSRGPSVYNVDLLYSGGVTMEDTVVQAGYIIRNMGSQGPGYSDIVPKRVLIQGGTIYRMASSNDEDVYYYSNSIDDSVLENETFFTDILLPPIFQPMPVLREGSDLIGAVTTARVGATGIDGKSLTDDIGCQQWSDSHIMLPPGSGEGGRGVAYLEGGGGVASMIGSSIVNG